jgi:hypothetical protein
MVRACLALDPLARPQSVFAVQKVLQAGLDQLPRTDAAAPAAAPDTEATAAPVSGWRGLVGRIGFGRSRS